MQKIRFLMLLFVSSFMVACANEPLEQEEKEIFNQPGVHFDYERGVVHSQYLISPNKDTLHTIEYSCIGEIVKNEGEYFYTIYQILDSADQDNTVKFESHIVIPDTSFIVNLYLAKFDKSKEEFVLIKQESIDNNFHSFVFSFKEENPVVNICVIYTYKNGEVFKNECYEPFMIVDELEQKNNQQISYVASR